MAAFRNICWWLVFLAAGIVLQLFVPGLDALLAGVVIVTQEKDYRTMVWLVPVILLLQEGMGSQYWGASFVTLACFFLLWRLTLSLSLVSRAAFTVLISLGMGGVRLAQEWIFAILQNEARPFEAMLTDAVIQGVWLLAAWPLLTRLRRPRVHDEKKSSSEA